MLFIALLTGCSDTDESTKLPDDDTVTSPVEIVPEEVVEEEPEEEDLETRVSFYGVGDNLIHTSIFQSAHQGNGVYDFKPIYKNIASVIEAADIAYINQETVLGGDERGFSGYPAFNTPSDMAGNLVELGFDIVNGSNNHTLDIGTTGLLNSLNYWFAYEDEILFTGAFESQEHRDTIPVVEKDGVIFSILTYTYGTNGIQPDAPYRVNYFNPDLITDDVNRAKELSDFVVVTAHWGDEHAFYPNQMQLDYAQLFADLEVDVVLGSHSHTIQPIEWITGETGHKTLVIYSLGNLVAASLSDINLLGGSISFDFVKDEDKKSVENIYFEPFIIHYEAGTPSNIDTRTNFEVIKLDDYTPELEQRHALNGYEGNVISIEKYQGIVDEVISEEFR